jgi:NAD(P)-dependent dehydrogenase (short-subunit alcohol dehydrogenase family)
VVDDVVSGTTLLTTLGHEHSKDWVSRKHASVKAMHPMQRMGKPEEIAYGIAWLLSDEASFVTGHVLNIDGGFQAK